MMLAIDRITRSAIAKRIELNNSTALRSPRWPDFNCKPDVVTLIQTPTEQQKRVEGYRLVTTPPPFSCFSPASTDRLHLRADLLMQARDVIGHSLDLAIRQTVRDGMHRFVVVASTRPLRERRQLRHGVIRPLPRQTRGLRRNPLAGRTVAACTRRDALVGDTTAIDLLPERHRVLVVRVARLRGLGCEIRGYVDHVLIG